MKTPIPTVGDVFTDEIGRTLVVTEVDLHDRLDRHVRGAVSAEGFPARPYACTITEWARTWRDRTPPTPVSRMTLR